MLYTDGLVEDMRNINTGSAMLKVALGTDAFRRAKAPATLLLESVVGNRARDDVAGLVADYLG